MATAQEMELAREVYYNIMYHLNNLDWKYDRLDNELILKSGLKSEDLPIEFLIVVKPENKVVQFISKLPFDIPEDKRVEAAIAICAVNYKLVDGSFDYDISDGTVMYRLTCSYRGNTITSDLVEYIIAVAAGTVDEYNDKLFMLAKDMMTLEQILNKINE